MERINLLLKVIHLPEDSILLISQLHVLTHTRFSSSEDAYIEASVNLLFHVLILLVRIDDVLDKRLIDSIDDAPERVAITLLLLLFEQLDLHVHEMHLFEQILYVLVLDVEVGVESKHGRPVVFLGNSF